MENFKKLVKGGIIQLVNSLTDNFEMVTIEPFQNCSSIGGGPGFTITARDLGGSMAIRIDRPASDLLEMENDVVRYVSYEWEEGEESEKTTLTTHQVHERWFEPGGSGVDEFLVRDENLYISYIIKPYPTWVRTVDGWEPVNDDGGCPFESGYGPND